MSQGVTGYDVVVVGAGPYGLSIATHLEQAGVRTRIFGTPMKTWREHMPAGMLLKSDGFASDLSDPGHSCTLKRYCASNSLDYDDRRVPVKLQTFVDYGLSFQQHLLPDLDTRDVVGVKAAPGGGFLVQLEGGEQVRAARVVLAIGISHFAYTPPELAALPADLVSHSSEHKHLGRFQGKDVTVIGAGASAVDLATLLHEAGANVCILTRRGSLYFHRPPSARPPSLREKLRHPSSGLGPGWPSWLCSNSPQLFRRLPQQHRLRIVRTHLGPSGGWPMQERFQGNVQVVADVRRFSASQAGKRVRLVLETGAGLESRSDSRVADHVADHVIAATGYRPDLARLRFLDAPLRSKVRTVADSPVLSSNFESSVPGLYFVGLTAAHTFGPLMRFAFGADYTAHRLADHLRQALERRRA